MLSLIVDAFMEEYPTVNVLMHLLEMPVNLVDEAWTWRCASPASRRWHTSHRWGTARDRGIAALPGDAPLIEELADLATQQIITMAHMGLDSWSFPPLDGSLVLWAGKGLFAVERRDVARPPSYPVASELEQDGLRMVLADAERCYCRCTLDSRYGRLSMPRCISPCRACARLSPS